MIKTKLEDFPIKRKTFSLYKTVNRNSQILRDSQQIIKTAAGSIGSTGPRCLTSELVDMVISSFVTLTPKMKEQFRKALSPSK